MDETSGVVTSASHFDGKKGQRFIIKVSAFDNHGRVPTNEAKEEATVQVRQTLVLLRNGSAVTWVSNYSCPI